MPELSSESLSSKSDITSGWGRRWPNTAKLDSSSSDCTHATENQMLFCLCGNTHDCLQCPSIRATKMSLVLKKGQSECPSKRATLMSFKKGNPNVHQKGPPECPSKRATPMSLKKDHLNVPQKGKPKCPLKRETQMSLKRETHMSTKRATWMPFNKDNIFVPK